MATQTLRGLQNAGGLHWRGDRTYGFFGLDSPYRKNGDADISDEALNFDNFIVAFPGLLGSALPPTDPQLQADMQAFTDFALELVLPPNPVARIDGTLTDAESAGRPRDQASPAPANGSNARTSMCPEEALTAGNGAQA